MTSFPGAGLARRQLPAVDHRQTGRRRSSAPRGPRHVRTVARCQVNDDQLARRWPCPPSASRRRSSAPRARPRGTSAPWGPWHDDQLAGAGLARRRSSAPRARPRSTSAPWGPWEPWHDDQLPRCQFSRRRITGTAARANRGTMTSLPGAGLAGVTFPPSIVGTLAGVDHRHHGHGRGEGPGAARSTMTSFPPSIVGTLPGPGAGLARRRSSAPRARPRGRPRRCQVNDDQLGRLSIDGHGDTCEPWGPWHDDQLPRRWPCPPSVVVHVARHDLQHLITRYQKLHAGRIDGTDLLIDYHVADRVDIVAGQSGCLGDREHRLARDLVALLAGEFLVDLLLDASEEGVNGRRWMGLWYCVGHRDGLGKGTRRSSVVVTVTIARVNRVRKASIQDSQWRVSAGRSRPKKHRDRRHDCKMDNAAAKTPYKIFDCKELAVMPYLQSAHFLPAFTSTFSGTVKPEGVTSAAKQWRQQPALGPAAMKEPQFGQRLLPRPRLRHTRADRLR